MKKLITGFLIGALLVLAGCSGGEEEAQTESTTPPTEEEPALEEDPAEVVPAEEPESESMMETVTDELSEEFKNDDGEASDDEPAEITKISVTAKEFSFTPSSMTVLAGTDLYIKLVNSGTTNHDLVVEELGVYTKLIGPGETDTLVIENIQAGTYTFYCSIAGHRSLGMEGTLTVK